MNAIMNKTNNGKLLAAIAVFAMIACVLAVAVPASATVTEGSSGEPIDFDAELAAYTGESPVQAVVSGLGATNAGLGNDISVTFDADTNTYYVTGTLNKQDIGYKDNDWTGMNQGDSAKVYYSYNWGYNDSSSESYKEYWALIFGTNANATYDNGVDEPQTISNATSIVLCISEENFDQKRSISYTTDNVKTTYNIDLSGVELSETSVAAGAIAVGDYVIDLPEGVTATASGNTISIIGEAVAASNGDSCENGTFGTIMNNSPGDADGYAFIQINGITLTGETVIKQTNSALSAYKDHIINNEIKQENGSWVKSKPYTSTDVENGYAFLVPKDNSTVTIAIGAETLTFNFDITSKAVAQSPTEVASLFENNDVVQYTPAAKDVIGMPDVEGKTLEIGDLSTKTQFTVNYMSADPEVTDPVTTTVFNIMGTGISIEHGSIILNGQTISGEITVSEDLVINTLEITNDNLVVNVNGDHQVTIASDVNVDGSITFNQTGTDATASVLIQDGVTVNLGTMTINENVRVNNYGSIEGGTVNVAKDGTFYSATPVNTTFKGDGTIDLSDAMETLKISDKLASSAVLKPTQNVLVNGNLTINKGEYLVITGSLEVQEGVTITINEGGLLMVYGPSASATINGTIISKGLYTGSITGIVDNEGNDIVNPAGFTYYDGKSIDVSGTINAKKATNENVRTVWIHGDSEISGTVTIDAKAVAQFGGETKVVEGGVLNINGTYAGTILNQGTVNLNGSVSTGASVAMNSTAAVLNVTALKGTNALEVTDEGLYLQTNDAGTRLTVPQTDRPANTITLQNVKGVTITEGYTYTTDDDGDRIVHNNLYIAGTLNAQDSKDEKVGSMSVTGGVLTVSGDLTIAKVDVTIGTDAKMNVTGNVYITNVDDVDFTGTGTLTVTGLVRSLDELEATGFTINAVKYEQTIENIPYYFYTNLAAAIESGEESLTVLGDLYILEDTTIPAGITVDASVNDVYVGDNERDITDITLTVANGGLLMAQKITVDATMMIENTDTGIDCNSIISDVSSTTETTAKYTNIYTALNQAQSGETVTITKSGQTDNGVVSIVRDVEIKDGVTLVVPAVNSLAISEGVTLTNNGTLDVRGSIDATDSDKDNTARFGTETVDEDNKEYAVIVNNGTIVSVAKMDYSKYQIAGAYYTINGKFYITPVEDAAAQIGNTETDSIVIYGKNTVGTVAFVGTVEEPVKVTIDATAEITADSMTVTNGTIVANGGAGVDGAELNGTYGGSTGTVVLANMTVPVGATLTIEDKAVTVSEQTSQVTYVSGDLNAITSNDSVDEEEANKQIVSSVAFEGAVTVQKTLDITMSAGFGVSNKDTVTVNGTLTIAGTDAKVDVKNVPMVIDGNVIVDNAGELVGDVSVLGNLDVKDKTDKTAAGTTDIGKLMIGAADYNYGTDVAASVSGTFSAKTVFVFSKAVLDDAAAAVVGDATVKSTEFYVEDALWMTAYDLGTVNGTAITNINGVAQIKPEKLTNSTFGYWQTLEDGQYKQITDAKDVGDVDAVYAYVNYEIYTVTVFADPGIDAVYIDGKLMTSGVFRDPVNGMWAEGFQLNVAAGEHEITYKLGNYFSGEAKMTVNGTAVTGNAFTTSGTDPEDTQVTIYLQGIEASAPETPSTGGSSDDGMGLTDYLLIILVVLIVVMAIIVALRLMRS